MSALLILLAAIQAAPALAGKVYRCGNLFQDLPCAEQKVADARPIETVRTPRDTAACAENRKEPTGRHGRTDCASRAREPQSVSQTDVKAR